MNCFGGKVKNELHLIYHSLINPRLEKNKKICAPQDWKPIVNDKFIYDKFSPFVYRPHSKIKHMNRALELEVNSLKYIP